MLKKLSDAEREAMKGRIVELCEAIRAVMQGQYYRPNFGS